VLLFAATADPFQGQPHLVKCQPFKGTGVIVAFESLTFEL